MGFFDSDGFVKSLEDILPFSDQSLSSLRSLESFVKSLESMHLLRISPRSQGTAKISRWSSVSDSICNVVNIFSCVGDSIWVVNFDMEHVVEVTQTFLVGLVEGFLIQTSGSFLWFGVGVLMDLDHVNKRVVVEDAGGDALAAGHVGGLGNLVPWCLHQVELPVIWDVTHFNVVADGTF